MRSFADDLPNADKIDKFIIEAKDEILTNFKKDAKSRENKQDFLQRDIASRTNLITDQLKIMNDSVNNLKDKVKVTNSKVNWYLFIVVVLHAISLVTIFWEQMPFKFQ